MIIDSLWTLVKIIKHFKYQAANIVFHYWSVNAEIRKWQAQYMRQNKELCGSFWRKHNIISRHVVKFVAAEHKFYYPVFFWVCGNTSTWCSFALTVAETAVTYWIYRCSRSKVHFVGSEIEKCIVRFFHVTRRQNIYGRNIFSKRNQRVFRTYHSVVSNEIH